jgi:hypothetical protein
MTAFDAVKSVAGGTSRETRLDFGVLLPHSSAAAEVPIQAGSAPRVRVTVQFDQTQARSIEAFVRDDFLPVARLSIDGIDYLSDEETLSRECRIPVEAKDGLRASFPIAIPGGLETDTLFDASHNVRGRIVRERWPLHGSVTVETKNADGFISLAVRIANDSDHTDGADRATMLRTSLRSLALEVSIDNG